MNGPVAIIGAGINGVAAAVWLARAGREVVLIDRKGPGEGTSYGNAGVLASASIVPVPIPGLLAKVPRMLLDPDGPLFLRPAHLPRVLPWLVRYLRYGREAEVRRTAEALALLIGDSVEQHRLLAAGTGAKRFIVPSDYTFVYKDRAAFAADALGWSLRREAGFRWEEIEGEAVRNYAPDLAPEFRFAVRLPDHGHIVDPGRYVQVLAAHAQVLGARVLQAEAQDFVFADGRLAAIETSAGRIPCAAAVISSGAWSGALMKRLGLAIPLESERGYHLEFHGANVSLPGPLMMGFGKFVATPMEGRLRVAGLVEFGGLDAGPSRAPLALLARAARRAFPSLAYDSVQDWMGHRPAPVDSLPLIGEVASRTGIYAAFGHHHVGLTGGAKTGRLVADLICGRRPNIDLSPFSPDRFSRSRRRED
jgi:D-amino-acid dehydrogenase